MENKDFLSDLKTGVKDIGKSVGGFFKDAFSGDTTDVNFPTDIYKTAEKYVIEMELAGVIKTDVSIKIQEQTLMISGKKINNSEAKNELYQHRSRRFGDFMRSFDLPLNIQLEGIKAKFDNGVLSITFPLISNEEDGNLKVNIE